MRPISTQALPKLAARGIAVERDIDHPARRAITIRDSSGIRLQFFVNRAWERQDDRDHLGGRCPVRALAGQ